LNAVVVEKLVSICGRGKFAVLPDDYRLGIYSLIT
jgi:hypothetical protein